MCIRDSDEIDQETAVLVSEEFGFQVNYQAEQSLKQEEIEYPKPNLNFSDDDKPTKRVSLRTEHAVAPEALWYSTRSGNTTERHLWRLRSSKIRCDCRNTNERRRVDKRENTNRKRTVAMNPADAMGTVRARSRVLL